MKIIDVPIEGFEERYSIQWRTWFSDYLCQNGIMSVEVYPDPLKSTRETGAFLDICGTNYFKAMQLAYISQLMDEGCIENSDVFLFHDLWFPGLEMLAYMRSALGIDFKITGCLHAGTWDPHDFLSKSAMGWWANDIESGWLKFVDAAFVATNFHKEMIEKYFEKGMPKIHVTGFPIFPQPSKGLMKERKVVFPHRLDEEKNPKNFDALVSAYKKLYDEDGTLFVKTKEKCKTKSDYYEELATSAISISFSDQETWGIAMIESVLHSCIPFVPNKLSYRELYPTQFKYNYDFTDPRHYTLLAEDVHKTLTPCPEDIDLMRRLRRKFILKGSLAIPRMIEIIMDL